MLRPARSALRPLNFKSFNLLGFVESPIKSPLGTARFGKTSLSAMMAAS
jgi:hypothetical protein